MNALKELFFKFASVDLGLLIFRLFFGITMMLAHGLPNLQRFSEIQSTFPDPEVPPFSITNGGLPVSILYSVAPSE